MNWQEKAINLLQKSLYPIPQELNELDWKGGLSNDNDRLAQHICAFSNMVGGGIMVFGINNNATYTELSQEQIERIVTRIDNIAQNRLFFSIQIGHAVLDFEGHPLLFIFCLFLYLNAKKNLYIFKVQIYTIAIFVLRGILLKCLGNKSAK